MRWLFKEAVFLLKLETTRIFIQSALFIPNNAESYRFSGGCVLCVQKAPNADEVRQHIIENGNPCVRGTVLLSVADLERAEPPLPLGDRVKSLTMYTPDMWPRIISCIMATPLTVYLFKHVKLGTEHIQNDCY